MKCRMLILVVLLILPLSALAGCKANGITTETPTTPGIINFTAPDGKRMTVETMTNGEYIIELYKAYIPQNVTQKEVLDIYQILRELDSAGEIDISFIKLTWTKDTGGNIFISAEKSLMSLSDTTTDPTILIFTSQKDGSWRVSNYSVVVSPIPRGKLMIIPPIKVSYEEIMKISKIHISANLSQREVEELFAILGLSADYNYEDMYWSSQADKTVITYGWSNGSTYGYSATQIFQHWPDGNWYQVSNDTTIF